MVRIKSRWSKKDKTHTPEEIGGAMAFIIWKLAMNVVLSMENAQYKTETQQDRIDIITEVLIFCIHIADRMTIERFDENERMEFMTALAGKCAKHLEDNMRDLGKKGEFKQPFIELMNQRFADYAGFAFDEDEGPSFVMSRFFGDKVKQVMKNEDDKKWVGQQMIDIEVPEIMDHFKRAIPNLFR
ncbi:MAG: hypothetical protein P8Y24_11510 [Gammaproteobacteria bacterium]